MQTVYEMPRQGGTIDVDIFETFVIIRWDEQANWCNAKFLRLSKETAALLAQEITQKIDLDGIK
jgi:hypothetical protein